MGLEEDDLCKAACSTFPNSMGAAAMLPFFVRKGMGALIDVFLGSGEVMALVRLIPPNSPACFKGDAGDTVAVRLMLPCLEDVCDEVLLFSICLEEAGPLLATC